MTAPLSTLRGSGPAPQGFYRCYYVKCPARRNPFNGRFEKTGTHYHPNVNMETPSKVARTTDGKLFG